MTKEPPKFEDVVKRLLTTPPKPHTAVAPKKSKGGGKAGVEGKRSRSKAAKEG
jgi:hypothetical protein